jgi:cyclopropane-fatty-acyl-phospholipid synthase
VPDGSARRFGTPGAAPRAALWVERDAFFTKLALHGGLWIGESYMDGDWRADDLARFIELGLRSHDRLARGTWLTRLGNAANYWLGRGRANTRDGSRRNVHAHYDLSNALFAHFLDQTMTYSSAIFTMPDEPLWQAQENKYRALAEKVALRGDDHVLEIGCGWGGFAIFAARTYGCRVTGLTVSEEQHALARERVRAAGLEHLVDIQFCDYRDVAGTFSKIVSIEMLEAVGQRHWKTYFQVCDRVLAPGGLMALQTIAVPDHLFAEHVRTAHWVQKYVFPGGLLPSLEALRGVLSSGTTLAVQHVEDIGQHYARTLALWRRAFLERLDEVRSLGFDARFERLWEFYLAGSEAGFRTGRLLDLQLVLGRER